MGTGLASELRGSPDRGWGSIPRPGGRSGDARRCRRAVKLASLVMIPTVCVAGTHAEQFAEIPDGLNVLLFSLKEDPQVVTYDPETLTPEALALFAADLCDVDQPFVTPVRARLAQSLQGRNRAHIFCTGDPQ